MSVSSSGALLRAAFGSREGSNGRADNAAHSAAACPATDLAHKYPLGPELAQSEFDTPELDEHREDQKSHESTPLYTWNSHSLPGHKDLCFSLIFTYTPPHPPCY